MGAVTSIPIRRNDAPPPADMPNFLKPEDPRTRQRMQEWADRESKRAELREMINSLPETQRLVLRMMMQDMTHEEIADALNVDRRSLTYRAATLRRRFNVKTNHGLVAFLTSHGFKPQGGVQ